MPNQARMKSRGGLATAALVLVIMSSQLQMTWADLVIINAQKDSGADQLKLCAMRRDLASPGKDGKTFPLVYLNRTDGACHELDPVSAHSITDRATFLWIRGQPQCSLAQIASNVEPNDPAMVIIGTNGPLSINKTLVNLSLPYIFMPDEYAQRLSKFLSGANDPTVYLEADTSKFDASLMVIWLIAVATVILGSLWTLHEFRVMSETSRQQHEEQLRQHQQQQLQLQQPKTMSSDEDLIGAETQENNTTNKPQATSINNNQDTPAKNIAANNNNPHKNPITIHIGYVSILVLLVIVVAMILLLYFFYNVMIYFVFFIFCVGSASAFYRIGCLFLSNKPLKTPIPTAKSKIFSIDLRKLFIALVSIAICIVWFVYRHQSWSWIIQDMMAFSLAVNALSYYRISTYKTVALILSLFFAYDVFMVFITPAFTKGTSIMEAVAFGGRDVTNSAVNDWNNIQFGTRVDTTNKLPVVIIIPHLGAFKRLCAYYYDYSVSLLGLGDILIPGLSTNYAIIYDYAKHGRASVYFFVNVIAYFLGLFLAFVALILMNTAQPALFYLCPVLIICSLITSLVRREFRSFWGGEPIHKLVASLHPETLGDEAINHDSVNGNNNNGNQSSLSADEQEQENETKHHISGRNTLKKNESTKAILSEIDSA